MLPYKFPTHPHLPTQSVSSIKSLHFRWFTQICKFTAATSDAYAEALARQDYISTAKLWIDIEKADGKAFMSNVLKITDEKHQVCMPCADIASILELASLCAME